MIGEDLLCAASKYQIAALSVACEAYLCHHVTDNTAIALLRLADMLALTKMKEYMMHYIAMHTAGVMKTKEFSSLDGELSIEVKELLDTAAKRKGCSSRTVGGDASNERKLIPICSIM